MKSEYDAHRHLRTLERSISQRYENGYDPYNSVDRWHCPLPLFDVTITLEAALDALDSNGILLMDK